MKNKALAALTALVLLFGGFTSGFFLGRNTRVAAIQTTKTIYETVPVLLQPPATAATDPAVPTETLPPQPTEPTDQPQKSQTVFPVNVNTADLTQLMELPGIGEVIGQRIIDYRSAHGPFQSLDELINVKGIGEKRLADLKPYATI